MSELGDSMEYRKKQSLEIIDQYRDLIKKYDALFDKDLLQKELEKLRSSDDDEKKSENEQKYLAKLKSRRTALEEKESILEKIEVLERHLEPSEGNNENSQPTSSHPVKKYTRQT